MFWIYYDKSVYGICVLHSGAVIFENKALNSITSKYFTKDVSAGLDELHNW